ncbi:MAG: class 1 isoprenoid biosynthesis enzyme [Polyangiaceae bacterium]
MHARVVRRGGPTSLDAALAASLATPFLQLTEALRIDLELADGDAISAIGEGTLALYFYLRAQDDMVDEPADLDVSFVYAAEVFAGASAEAYARAIGGDAAFWSLRRRVLDDLAAVSAWELDTLRSVDPAEAAERAEEHATRLGDKLGPIAIPLAATAIAARRPETIARLHAYSLHLGRALQVANDLLNARDDHVGGRLTPSLAALYAGGRVTPETPPFQVWPSLAADPASERMLAFARREIDRALALLADIGAPALTEATRRGARVLDEMPSRLLGLSLGVRR